MAKHDGWPKLKHIFGRCLAVFLGCFFSTLRKSRFGYNRFGKKIGLGKIDLGKNRQGTKMFFPIRFCQKNDFSQHQFLKKWITRVSLLCKVFWHYFSPPLVEAKHKVLTLFLNACRVSFQVSAFSSKLRYTVRYRYRMSVSTR